MDGPTPRSDSIVPMGLQVRKAGAREGLRPWRSVRGTLTLLVAATMLPLILVQAGLQYERLRTRRSEELQANLELARAVGVAFDRYVQGVLNQELSIGLALTTAPPPSPEQATQLLCTSADDLPALHHYSWVDPWGKIVASSDAACVGRDISRRTYFQVLQAGRDWAVSDLLSGLESEEPAFVIARALRDGRGQLQGVVSAGVHPEHLGDVLPVQRPSGGGIAIMDRRGRDVYRYLDGGEPGQESDWAKPQVVVSRALAGEEVQASYAAGPAGRDWMAALAPIGSLGWVAEAGRPADLVMGSLANRYEREMALLGLALLVALWAAALTARRLTVPLERLHAQALAVGRGDLSGEVTVAGPKELGELAAAFNGMTREIREREQEQSALLADLQESEGRYRSLFETALDAILVTDGAGRVVDANARAGALSGYSRDELLGMSVFDLFPERERRREREIVARFGWQTRLQSASLLRRKDGDTLNVEFSATRVGPERYQAVLHDVSERRRAEAERERLLREVQRRAAELDATLGAVADGLIIYGPAGEILFMNAAASAMLALSADTQARPMAERLASLRPRAANGDRLAVDDMPPARALRGETVRGYVHVVHPATGKTLWLSSSAAPIRAPNGELLGAVSTFTDITAMHEMQEQREDLLRAVSHDLRGPLTVIHAQAELLLRGLQGGSLTGREPRGLRAILTGARRMNAMIEDLVDSVRLEAGQIQLRRRPVDLRSFVLDLKERLAGTLETARIRVEAGEGAPAVSADPDRLERILTNLLSNALKYSPPSSQVTVAVGPRDGEAVVAVADQGQGIAADDRAHLFERYFRSSTAREQREGLGLGLYITRMLVEAHGGRIWVESAPGRGSTFYVALPNA